MIDLSAMSRGEKIALLELLEERDRRETRNRFQFTFPDTGKYARKLYSKQCQFFKLGAAFNERALFGGNRSGKTVSGAYEMTAHLTGRYPYWWEGRRFSEPVTAWTAGDTAKSVRDIMQATLLGKPGDEAAQGTGMIPGDLIMRTTPKHGLADSVETVFVKHSTGGVSTLQFKSYDQGRDAFQGTSNQVIHLDEECPLDIYAECLLRTMTVDGIIYLTATPLKGLTDIILSFLPDMVPATDEELKKTDLKYDADDEAENAEAKKLIGGTKATVFVEWNDVPHLSEKQKKLILSGVPPWQRQSRSTGIPQLGAGAIYQIAYEEINEPPIIIPEHWRRCYALDVGWKRSAAAFMAHDPDTDIVHIYDEVYRANEEPSLVAAAIKARGEWIPGVIDPAARGRNQKDGTKLIEQYRDLGLDIMPANNAREAGLYACWERLSTSRMRVFNTCKNFAAEYRIYRRDDKGQVVKSNDHLMDCMRYGVMSGLARAVVKPLQFGKRWWDKPRESTFCG